MPPDPVPATVTCRHDKRMLMMTQERAKTRFSDWPLAMKSILGFWLFYAVTVVARAFLGSDPLTTVENKLIVIVVGIVLTALIYLAIAAFASAAPIRRKAGVAIIASVIASTLLV